IAGDDRLGGGGEIVGEQDSRLVVAEIGNVELAEVALVRSSLLLVVARGTVLAAGDIELDGAPGRWRQPGDFGEQFWCAPAQGDESDAGGVEPIQAVVGSELGVEDEVVRHAAISLLPERDEAEDLLGLLALADIGVGIAEHLAVSVLRQEGEYAGLAAAALGQIVGLDQRMLAEIGHGVKIQIERGTLYERLVGQLTMPQVEQAGDL